MPNNVETDLAVEVTERRANDLLIQTNLKSMCRKLDKLLTKADAKDEFCLLRADHVHNQLEAKVSFVMFKWIIGLCIAGLVFVGGATYQNTYLIKDVRHQVVEVVEQLDAHQHTPIRYRIPIDAP